MTANDALDPVWKALSDSTRRSILDLLRDGPKRTTDIVNAFPALSRFGVMKHLDVLKEAQLVIAERDGRTVINRLNAVPLRRIYERWVSQFEDLWASQLLRIQEFAEDSQSPEKDESNGV